MSYIRHCSDHALKPHEPGKLPSYNEYKQVKK